MKKITILLISLGISVLAMAMLSLFLGTARLSPTEVWNALFHFDSDNLNHQIIWDLRIPRTIGSITVGAAFATSGAVMQGITRNPLADAGILGINAGAAFALSISIALFASMGQSLFLLSCFLGATISTFIVYGLTGFSHGKQNPMRLALAGAAVAALFSALSQAIALHFQVGQEVTFWTAGGVAGIRMAQLYWSLPFILIALVGAVILSPTLSILSIGEDGAKGLGVQIGRTKRMCMVLVLVLAGAAVSLSGPIAFVGLIIPHISRVLTGPDYRKIIPCSIVMGSLFMVGADLLSRMINPPHETPIGLIFAMLGVPFFLYLVRKGGGKFE